MSERDPFENLRDLIDEPVAPREHFAAELRSRLMSDLSASSVSREEHRVTMDGAIDFRPRPVLPIRRPRALRPMAILELAAVALVVLGLVAALSRGWFGNDPETPTTVPAAALQSDNTPTPAQAEPTATAAPVTTEAAVAPGNIPGTVWILPPTGGEGIDFGGMVVDDDVVYRLLATPSFVGIQAVDGQTGAVKWQQEHQWAGNLFAEEDGALFFDGGGNTLAVADAQTGQERWRASLTGSPIAVAEDDTRIFVLLDGGVVTALDEQTGDQLWSAQGAAPQNATGAATAGHIAVEDHVVAALSPDGVLAGFDAETGHELWSHEGHDAATASIWTEDDHFLVIQGLGSAESLVSGGAAGSAATGNAIVNAIAVPVDCNGAAVTPGAGSGSLGVQAIDPKTGEIRAEHHADSLNGLLCAIEADSGSHENGDDHPHAITIGTISADTPVSIHGHNHDDGTLVLIGTIDGIDGQPVAAVADGRAVFIQLADGSLVKVESHSSLDGDDHDDHDDSGDDHQDSEHD